MQNTGGGTNIAGNASVDGDFVNRDQLSTNQGNQVHVAVERLSEVSQWETDEIRQLSNQIGALAVDVTALTHALVGDARYGSTGLVQQVREMDQTNRSRERWRMVSTWASVVLVVMQAVQWYFVWRIYDLYWVIYQAVN
jgi:hypothetical protein